MLWELLVEAAAEGVVLGAQAAAEAVYEWWGLGRAHDARPAGRCPAPSGGERADDLHLELWNDSPERRGEPGGDVVLVVGQTGAGKSSLVNLIKGEAVCRSEAVASTTRSFQSVRAGVGGREVCLVDTP